MPKKKKKEEKARPIKTSKAGTHKTESKKSEVKVSEKYFYAVGRRKASVAQVKLFPKAQAGEDDILVNKKKMKEYFTTLSMQSIFMSPFKTTGTVGKFKIQVSAKGGGFRGQAEAARLGISRAIVSFDENLRKVLKDSEFLTRDARKVERKKPGLKKARRAPQWKKR